LCIGLAPAADVAGRPLWLQFTPVLGAPRAVPPEESRLFRELLVLAGYVRPAGVDMQGLVVSPEDGPLDVTSIFSISRTRLEPFPLDGRDKVCRYAGPRGKWPYRARWTGLVPIVFARQDVALDKKAKL
jgi:hypothetical protein